MSNTYQNHVDKRIREMHERMLKFKKGKKKKQQWAFRFGGKNTKTVPLNKFIQCIYCGERKLCKLKIQYLYWNL